MRYLHININTLYRVIPLAVLRMSPHSVSALVQLRGSTTVNWPGPAPPSRPAHTIAEVFSNKPCNTQTVREVKAKDNKNDSNNSQCKSAQWELSASLSATMTTVQWLVTPSPW